VTNTSWPSTEIGCSKCVKIRRATVPAANRSRVSGSRTMNSSPPRRESTASLTDSMEIVAEGSTSSS
jgi:hypothetical protein